MKLIGHVSEMVRYPVKSMAGTAIEASFLGWHGLSGDRRFAFRKLEDASGFPWLTASRVPELVLYHPFGLADGADEPFPTHVRSPDSRALELSGEALRTEIAERYGSAVELMKLKHGVFDDASVSIISMSTIAGIGREARLELDRRRFRANLTLATVESQAFAEDEWVGGTLLFGESDSGPAVSVTARDVRCKMINLDPETAAHDARVLRAVVELNDNHAGVYATVVRTGLIRVGDPVRLRRASELS